MIFVGIDPDLHCTAVGVWDDGPIDAWVIETKKRKGVIEQAAVLEMAYEISENFPFYGSQVNVYCVEAQTLHIDDPKKKHRRPQDIVTLGNVGGAILGYLFTRNVPPSHVLFPTPWEWKKALPKAVMQAKFYVKLGWGYEIINKCEKYPNGEYAIPLLVGVPGFEDLKPAYWKHAGDALMLAKWASENWKPIQPKNFFLNEAHTTHSLKKKK